MIISYSKLLTVCNASQFYDTFVVYRYKKPPPIAIVDNKKLWPKLSYKKRLNIPYVFIINNIDLYN